MQSSLSSLARRLVLRSSVVATAATVAATVLAGPPSQASTAAVEVTPVFPGMERHERVELLDDGRPAVANVLTFAVDDPGLTLRPLLARDTLPGLETVPSMGQRHLPDGGVAGINAGFWLSNPVGDPNGYFAVDGEMVSSVETQGTGPRGTYGVRADGTVLFDRVDGQMFILTASGDAPVPLTAVNRYPRTVTNRDGQDTSFVYTSAFGEAVTATPLPPPECEEPEPPPSDDPSPSPSPTEEPEPCPPPVSPPMRVLVVEDVRAPSAGGSTGTITFNAELSSATPVAIPEDGVVVVAHGGGARGLANAQPEESLAIVVDLLPQHDDPALWQDVVDGIAVGPLIVKNGAMTDPAGWADEGFNPATHSNARHPRSALAVTHDGRFLLVTVDGRQSGYSHGMTLHELAHFLRQLGARDGLSLDGGGSSQFVVDGILRNRPCCDQNLRPVATGLFVFHDYPFSVSQRIAGSGREATAAAVAQESHPNGSDVVLLANGGGFADALAGGPLASTREAPLLLTRLDDLPTATSSALGRLAPRTVTLLGGQAVISPAVEADLRARGYTVNRLAGRDRTETAAAVAGAMGPLHPRVFLAWAGGFADALSAAGPAGQLGIPILLTATDQLPQATRQVLASALTEEVIIVGGTGVISPAIEAQLRQINPAMQITRLAGSGRYATAAEVNDWAMLNVPLLDRTELIIANGSNFPDALAGGPLAASRGQLLMIVPAVDVYADPDAAAWLADQRFAIKTVTLLGGHAVLSSFQHWQLDQLAQDVLP